MLHRMLGIEEREEFGRVLTAFFDQAFAEPVVRRLSESDTSNDPELWAQMSQQLDLQGMAIPERFGGSGFEFADLYPVFFAMGATLACAPYFATIALAANALLLAGDDDAADLLRDIAAGTTVAALAWQDGAQPVLATGEDDEWRLTGRKSFVIDAADANLIVVVATTPRGPTLFAIDPNAPGVTVCPLVVLDRTRRQGDVILDSAVARRVGADGAAAQVLRETLVRACAALAAEQAGGASRATSMAVEYAKVREQFGRAIGSFQAIKHKCAHMLVLSESARVASLYAFAAVAAGGTELDEASSIAKAFCSEAYFNVAADCIHIHGGIGFTWEHPAHLYFRRAKSSQVMLGTPTWHRQRLADGLLKDRATSPSAAGHRNATRS
jgi:alkylation response protein AidB-like acyl-CoA dehydrogenase